MQARKVTVAHGWLWIRQGVNLILHNPVLTLLYGAILGMGLFLVTAIPLFGPMLGVMLLPTLVGGYMRACMAMEQHEPVGIAHLAAGFRTHTSRMVALGGILLAAVLGATAVTVAIGGDPLVEFLKQAQEIQDPNVMWEKIQSADESIRLAFVAGATLLLLASLCMQFAPMLVLFHAETPFAALKSSLQAILRNIWPYTVYSLIVYLVVMALSLLPAFITFILVPPFALTSLYAAYRDLFAAEQAGGESQR